MVAAIHRRPESPWTAAALAGLAGMSKSTLNRRFLATTGLNPVGYLTRWRMSVAASRLRDRDEPIERVARSVGYTSVYAFTRAFHPERGMPPSRFRQLARAPRTG
ncbi:AraC family transcriptional regulator [Cryptosporangium japonicum]|uniref:HTH araC/xylS-type domain-containing protein n=1 Tax=Cryptosporangium japonicum TaxID=80872 RepID=A0ABN0V5P9_9ACTN